MKIYKGASASPGLVLGQVSRLERHVETFSDGPFNPEREQRMLDEAIHRPSWIPWPSARHPPSRPSSCFRA